MDRQEILDGLSDIIDLLGSAPLAVDNVEDDYVLGEVDGSIDDALYRAEELYARIDKETITS